MCSLLGISLKSNSTRCGIEVKLKKPFGGKGLRRMNVRLVFNALDGLGKEAELLYLFL